MHATDMHPSHNHRSIYLSIYLSMSVCMHPETRDALLRLRELRLSWVSGHFGCLSLALLSVQIPSSESIRVCMSCLWFVCVPFLALCAVSHSGAHSTPHSHKQYLAHEGTVTHADVLMHTHKLLDTQGAANHDHAESVQLVVCMHSCRSKNVIIRRR